MKIVFNFKTAMILAALAALAPRPAHAEGVYFSPRDLLADFFRSSKDVTYKKVEVGGPERAKLLKRLGYAPARNSYTFYVATSAGKVDGYAIIDEENGEHLPITFADRKSTRLNSSHIQKSRMPSSA